MELSDEQKEAFDKYILGENVFITGPGGTGKSELIRKIYADAKDKEKQIQVCAMTGCAAVLLKCKAKTVHSWAGIGLASGLVKNIIKKVTDSKMRRKNWQDTDILIIDEVSMMSLKMFDLLNELGQAARKINYRPFGGMQVIFSGDFFQLPPIGQMDEPETCQFCFESAHWRNVFPPTNQIMLQKIFRQSDPVYASILNQIREGQLKRSSNDVLLQHVGKEYPPDNPIRPTKLFPTRNKVETINNAEMLALESDQKTFQVKKHTDLPILTKAERLKRAQFNETDIEFELNYLTSSLTCDQTLRFKVGCQVMCTVNIDLELPGVEMLCNGSQGVVTGFSDSNCPIVKFRSGLEIPMGAHIWASEVIPGLGVSQIPLILAWALTIHKAQGATLDVAEVDVGSGIFECGQTYVALSRVKSLDGLYLTSFDAAKIKIHKKVKEFYEDLKSNSTP